MILRRALKYGIGFLCLFFVISCVCIYEHRDILAAYFTNSISSVFGIGLYILIFAVGIGLMVKSLFR